LGVIQHAGIVSRGHLDVVAHAAGDAFFSLSAPLVGSGCDPFLAGFVGNAVGAMKIRIVGHRHTITRAEVVKYLTSLLK
jgi:hypothetical protein